MIWSKKALAAMQEGDLCQQVLVPLFEAMGYQDVYYYHGGPGEQGKDIVMWMSTPLAGRSDVAVVAKAGDIKGGAGARISQTIMQQVNQCFGSPYNDPKTGHSRSISHCFVITSRKFPKDSREGLRAAMPESTRSRVTMMGGDELWKHIEQHLANKLILSNITSSAALLNEASPEWGIEVSIRHNGSTFQLVPKTSTAKRLEISLQPAFPDTPEGRQAKADFERYERTGEPVTLHSGMIASLNVPEFLQVLMPLDNPDFEVTLGRRFRLPRPIETEATISTEHESFTISHITFTDMQVGSEGALITNEPQDTPFKFTLSFAPQTLHAQLNFRYDAAGRNIYRLWQIIKIMKLFSQGAHIVFRDSETGMPFGDSSELARVEAPDDRYIELIEKLLFIQQHTKVLFITPVDDSFSSDEVADILTVHDALVSGFVPANKLTATLSAQATPDLRQLILTENSLRVIEPDHVLQLLGNDIHLGPLEITCERAIIHQMTGV